MNLIPKLIVLGCLLSTMSFSFFQEKVTAEKTRVLFILDGSGSMWQQLKGQHKIAMAKTVMKNLVDKLPTNAEAGLIAYGHTHKSDCNDIATLVPLGPLDKNAFSTTLDAINPQGKTPIALSLNHALAILRSETTPVTVVLVTDGLETCEGDACDLVRKAKSQGVKITLHVIGFGIAEQDLSSMECLAQAGGGQYLPANDALELAEALDQTVEEQPLEAGYLSVKTTAEGKLLDCAFKVFKKGSAEEVAVGRTYSAATTNPRVLLLPTGNYEVEVTALAMDGRPIQKINNIDITGPDTLKKEVDFGQASIEILVTRNGALSDATISILPAGGKKQITGGRSYRHATHNPAKFKVLPGTYDIEVGSVEIAGKPIHIWQSQVVTSSNALHLSHEYKSGEVRVGAKQGANYVDAVVSIVHKTTGKLVTQGRTYMHSTSNPASFIIEPGQYKVEVKAVKPGNLGSKSFELDLKAGETQERTAEY